VPHRYQVELAPDLVAATFSGHARIDIEVVEPLGELILNAAELEVTAARLSGAEATAVLAGEDRVVVATGATIAVGAYVLELEFTGILNDQLRGFYRSTFDSVDGPQVIATTQFEPADARRAFPCWDEPDFKATFALSLVVDEHLTALSNGAVTSQELLGDGRCRVVFAETMLMSTYLVAFVVGPFECTEPLEVDGVPLRVAAVPGKAQLTSFAVEVGAHSLHFLAGYFALPYPHDKIDHVAIPDFAFGAMENLGCVTYRETALLVDPSSASQLELKRVAQVVAHETAHMWFGDLVTMRWWNGIWLNEAFATFMELTTIDAFRPQWEAWTAFGVSKAAALGTDGLWATRPVEFEVGPPDEAEAMFDVLTYEKGGAVLKMLEQYLGAEVFRAGIAAYLDAHRYSNTETTDLWDAIETSSGEPVRSIMDTWIFQGGYPLVTAGRGADERTVTLHQRRFIYDQDGERTGQSPGERWAVPVNLRAGVAGQVVERRVLLEEESVDVVFDEALEWVLVNDGSWGFYRVGYADDLLERLLAGAASLNALERMSLVGDVWARVVSGDAELEEWVTVVRHLRFDDDPDVLGAILGPLDLLDLVARDEDRPQVAATVRKVAGPLLELVGWEPAPDEAPRRGTVRARLIAALGTAGADGAVRQEATRRLERWWETGTGLAPDLLSAVTTVVASQADEARYEELHERYRNAATPQEHLRYLYALGHVDDTPLLERTLDLCLTSEVRSQDAPMLIGAIMSRRAGRRVALDWVEAHWAEAEARYPRNNVSRMLEGITSLVEPDLTDQARRLVESHPLPQAQARLRQLLERMAINSKLAERIRPTLAGALESAL